MATIRCLPSGSWNVQVRIKGQAPKSKTLPTREQAEAWASQEESLHRLSKLTEAAQWPTVKELGMAYAEAKLKGFYPVSTDGLIKAENSRLRRATLRRMRGLWNRSM